MQPVMRLAVLLWHFWWIASANDAAVGTGIRKSGTLKLKGLEGGDHKVGRRLQSKTATSVITAWAALNPSATVLQLPNQNLTGPLPSLLSRLTSLQIVDLSGNLLTGSIPDLSSLTQLVSLDLSRNRLTGSVPSSLSTQLQLLNLTSNSLTGPIPSNISVTYPGLQVLDLGLNALNGSIPNLKALSALRSLRLHNNLLTGAVPPFTSNLALVELWLQGNQLSGTIPSSLAGLQQLTTLWLCCNRLSGSMPEALGNLSSLVSLRLNSNALTGQIPQTLGRLSQLQELVLSSNQLTGSIPSTLGSLGNLRLLQLFSNQLSGVIPPLLGNAASLTSLQVSLNQLTGVLPPSLGNLSNLVDLNVRGNLLTGPIPETLCSLQKLETLSLYSNPLSGTLPPCLGTLITLTVIWIERTSISGPIPPSYGSLTNLHTLILRLNELTGPIPDTLGNLVNCEFLSLHTNQLTGSIPESLGNLKKLDQLWLHSNRLTGTIPDSLGSMSMLTQLWLYNNALTGPLPASLGNLTMLSRASVSTNQLSGSLPASIGSLTKLTKFNFHVNSFTGSIPESFANLQLMQSASFASNHFSGPLPSWLGNWTQILDLDMSNNQFTGSLPAGIGLMTLATALRFSNNALQGPIPDVFGNMTALQTLQLEDNGFTGAVPPSMGRLLQLQSLLLQNNKLSGSIPSTLASLPLLTTLAMDNNSFTGVLPDFSNSTNLTTLTASNNQLVGARSMSSSIVSLDVSYNQLQALPPWESLPNLQTLLLNNNNITTWPLRGVMTRNSFTNEHLGAFICGRSVVLPQFSWPVLRRLALSSNPLNTEARNLVWSVMYLPQLVNLACRRCGLTLDIPRFYWLTSTGDRLCNGQQTLQPGFLQLSQLDLSRNSITMISDVPPPGLQIVNLASNLLGTTGPGLEPGWWNSAYPRLYLVSNLQVTNNSLVLNFVQGPLASTCDLVPITAGLSANFLGFTPYSEGVECTGLCNPPGILYGTDRGTPNPAALCRCAPGYQGSGMSCTPCGPNTYSFALDQFGMNRTCLPCPNGSKTLGALQTSVCACLCPVSTFLQLDEGLLCTDAPKALPNASCAACGPLRTTLAAGSLKASDCICDLENVPNLTQFLGMCGCGNGYYFNSQTVACHPCATEGEHCEWGGNMSRSLLPPDLLPGYWAAAATGRRLAANATGSFGGNFIYRCYSPEICIDNLGTCALGRGGTACALCLPGRSGSPDTPCKQCAVSPKTARLGFALAFVAAVWSIVVIMHLAVAGASLKEEKDEDRPPMTRALSALMLVLQQELTYAQIISIVGTSLAPIPQSMKIETQQVAGITLSFMDLIGVACFAEQQSPVLDFAFKWGFPAAVLLVGLMTPLVGRPLGWLLSACTRFTVVRKQLSRGISGSINGLERVELGVGAISNMGLASSAQVLVLLAVQTFGPTLVYNGLSLFTCLPQPNGLNTVKKYPYLECSYHSEEWGMLAPIAATYLAVILLLILVVQAFAWREALTHLAQSGFNSRGRWQQFFEPHRTSHLHWLIVSSLFRDIAVNFLNAFFAGEYRWRALTISFLLFGYSCSTFVEQPFLTAAGNMSESLLSACVAVVSVLIAIGAPSSDGLMLTVLFLGFGVPPALTLVHIASTLETTRSYVPFYLRSFERVAKEKRREEVDEIMEKLSFKRLLRLDTLGFYSLKQLIAVNPAFADTDDPDMTLWTAIRNLSMLRLRRRVLQQKSITGEWRSCENPEENPESGLASTNCMASRHTEYRECGLSPTNCADSVCGSSRDGDGDESPEVPAPSRPATTWSVSAGGLKAEL